MTRRLSEKTKKERHMGEGVGKDYLPYITTSEFNSLGTTSVIVDWKTGRGVHCLSQGEAYWYYVLRWDDDNVDIREQYPLDINLTKKIAEENGIRHPNETMTTDFLVTKKDGSFCACSIKTNHKSLDERTLEKLSLEKLYWKRQGVKFLLLFKENLNFTKVQNIRRVITYYDSEKVFDNVSLVKHKIATKEIEVNMDEEIELTKIMDDLFWERGV